MKTSTLIAAIAVSFAAAGTAFAQEATYELPQPATSSITRAQVQADLAQARADGSLRVTEADYQKGTPSESIRSRAEVQGRDAGRHRQRRSPSLNSEQNSFGVIARSAMPETAMRTAQVAR